MKISLLWKCIMKQFHGSTRQLEKELVRNYENQSSTELQYEISSWKCRSVGERIVEDLWKSVSYGNAIWKMFMKVHASRWKNWWEIMKISLLRNGNMKHVHASARQSEKELVRNYENQSPTEMQYEAFSWKCTSVRERTGEESWKAISYGNAIWNIFMEVHVSPRKN